MGFDLTKFLARFLDEAREHLAGINDGLLILERNPADRETMHAVFRAAHSIKGGARMVKQSVIAECAHRMEDLLDELRSGKIPLNSQRVDLLFQATDALGVMLNKVATGEKPPTLSTSLLDQLTQALKPADQEVVSAATNPPEAPETVSPDQSRGDPPDDLTSRPAPSGPPSPEKVAAPILPVSAGPEPPKAALSPTAETIRISAAKLDHLIKLMGEIISAETRHRHSFELLTMMNRQYRRLPEALNRLLSRVGDIPEAETLRRELLGLATAMNSALNAFRDDALTQELLTTELQDVSLKLRMLPLATVFDTFAREVRDLSRSLGKEVEFTVRGGETELDKNVIEKIGDPLLHLIRNAIDHGLESAEERRQAGKSPVGHLALSANSTGNGVLITIQDDGRGISPARIREKASQKKMVDQDTLDRMSETELLDLIFWPGFSTSPIITDLSGRGVGLDVVRKNVVDDLKGTVRVETHEGQGSAFHLRLPLTLAILRLLLVEAGGMTWAFPAHGVREIVTVQTSALIEVVNKKVFKLREQLVPLEDLASVLGRPEAEERSELLVIVVDSGNDLMGFRAQALITEENMVVKPFPTHLKGLRLVTGVTVGGSGGIINVLNVSELARVARDLSYGRKVTPSLEPGQKISILVVDDSLNTREIERSILETHGYEVTLAADGVEALEKTAETEFDAVITDLEMPRLDGFSLTERLRADERYRFTPIIMVTSLEKEEDKRRGIAVGADAYIVKGAFDQTNLLETVRNLTG